MKARRTRSQDRVIELLKSIAQPISAQDLYVKLRNQGQTTGLATVYRALEALKLAGLVQARTVGGTEALYSLAQEDQHHLTCVQCGKSVAIEGCPVHELEVQLHQSHQFKIYYHMLEFFGLCTYCQTGEPASDAGV